MLRGTVTSIVLAPYSGVVTLSTFKARQRICHRSIGSCLGVIIIRNGGLTVHVKQVFSTIARIFIAWRHIIHVTHLDDGSIGRMDNHVVSTTHQAFSLTVHIPVETDEIPLFIRTCHEVGTKVNPPKACTVQFVAFIMMELGGVGSIEDIACIIALDQELNHTVTIHVA